MSKPYDSKLLAAMFAEQPRENMTDPEWCSIRDARVAFTEAVQVAIVSLDGAVPDDMVKARGEIREVALVYATCINGANCDHRAIIRAVESVHLAYLLVAMALANTGATRARFVSNAILEAMAASLIAGSAISVRKSTEGWT